MRRPGDAAAPTPATTSRSRARCSSSTHSGSRSTCASRASTAELATLPGAYAPPRGRLLLAGEPGTAFGCIALRPLAARAAAPATRAQRRDAVGEVKRLYVQPAHRGDGWGRRLAEALIAEARAIGYRELKLDTLDWMADARALYARLGFRECAPYYDNPLAGVVYMALAL